MSEQRPIKRIKREDVETVLVKNVVRTPLDVIKFTRKEFRRRLRTFEAETLRKFDELEALLKN